MQAIKWSSLLREAVAIANGRNILPKSASLCSLSLQKVPSSPFLQGWFGRRGLATQAPSSDLMTAAEGELATKDEDADNTPVPAPLIVGRQLEFFNPNLRIPRQAWVENLDTVEERKLGMVDLHPSVFGAMPRTEIISDNIHWQTMYKRVNYKKTQTKNELRGGGRKPWPQKGTGRARHGSNRSPIWIHGTKIHGPRGPKTYFYMLPFNKRLYGLCATLSVKLAQDDLKIVDTLDIPSDDPKFLQDLVDERKWGLSVLFVDDSDIVPRNIALATDSIGHMNLMPAYGLNIYSMLKHETLVLTVAAVNKIEERLLFHLNANDPISLSKKYRTEFV